MRSLFPFVRLLLLTAGIYGTALVALAGESISITLKRLDGSSSVLAVDTDDKVGAVKEKLSEKDDVPAEKHRLIYRGHMLEDDKTLGEYGIKNGDELFVMLRL